MDIFSACGGENISLAIFKDNQLAEHIVQQDHQYIGKDLHGVVFIMLGTNDAKRQFSTNSISLEKGIRTLMYRALNPENYRDGSKLPKFFVVCPPKMNVDGLKNERTASNFGQAGFDILVNTKPYLEKGCSGLNVEVIDTSAVAGSLDGIHMDEKGHKLVADALISIIKEL